MPSDFDGKLDARQHSLRAARIETRDIFRRMIEDEVRNGRLTRSRRARIVRYAAQMGLSAVETGRLIQSCRAEAILGDDPTARYHALRLVEPPRPRISRRWLIGLISAGALLIEFLVLQSLR